MNDRQQERTRGSNDVSRGAVRAQDGRPELTRRSGDVRNLGLAAPAPTAQPPQPRTRTAPQTQTVAPTRSGAAPQRRVEFTPEFNEKVLGPIGTLVVEHGGVFSDVRANNAGTHVTVYVKQGYVEEARRHLETAHIDPAVYTLVPRQNSFNDLYQRRDEIREALTRAGVPLSGLSLNAPGDGVEVQLLVAPRVGETEASVRQRTSAAVSRAESVLAGLAVTRITCTGALLRGL